jgi:DNA polymerase-3 subunit delta
VPQRGQQKWVAEQFELHGARAEPEACRALVALAGDDLYALASEIDKLATWAGGETITLADVEASVAPGEETSNFALTDAWGARDVAAVLRAAEARIERSGDPRSKTIPLIAGTLTGHVTRIQQVQSLDAEGVSAKEAAARLRQHPFYVGKLYAQARNYSSDELREIKVRLAELDYALKGGSRLAGELELERALVEVTEQGEPPRV